MKLNLLLKILVFFFLSVVFHRCKEGNSVTDQNFEKINKSLNHYLSQLELFREEFGGTYALPDVSFFLFGMGNREKYLYRDGELIEIRNGKSVNRWSFRQETLVPNEYAVYGITDNGEKVLIQEDKYGIWISDSGGKQNILKNNDIINLPVFEDHRYNQILKVLHQEILVNILDSKPLPNYFVYRKPWRRDAAMMAMCLEVTNNLHLIENWVLSITDAYDMNNGVMQGNPEQEADNLGQTLYLLSLYTDKKHPAVRNILNEIPRWEIKDNGIRYIRGRSDFQEVPVYQTKWLIYGLDRLGIEHNFSIPRVPDNYSSLFWWDYKNFHIEVNEGGSEKYPYLTWARDHFHLKKNGLISDKIYPLTWETEASQADYSGMQIISADYEKKETAAPHTWHAAEVFLYLFDIK